MPQTYATHRKLNPLFHFVAQPILLAYLIGIAVVFYRNPGWGTAADVVVAFGLVVGVSSARLMALTLQDRLIRLEETLRLQRLLPPDLARRQHELSLHALVALRFASDAEVPDLVRRTLAGEFGSGRALRDPLKKAIRDWRPDEVRV